MVFNRTLFLLSNKFTVFHYRMYEPFVLSQLVHIVDLLKIFYSFCIYKNF